MNFEEKDEIYLEMHSNTLEKDTNNGLYDYTSKEIKEYNTSITDNIYIKRRGQDILEESSFAEDDGIENLFHISKVNEEKYIFENEIETNMEQNEKNISKINNKIWYVINKINKKYYLTRNDVIKLGRIKYIIKEESIYSGDIKYTLQVPPLEDISKINLENANKENLFNPIKEVKLFEIKNPEEKNQCKICYSEETDPINNPMVHLCNCKGGLNFAHFDCIKQWMKTKLQLRENSKKTVKSYFIPKFNCEICKVPYPYKFKLSNRNEVFELIDIERPKENYIILESLDHIKENNENNKFIHVIKLINEEDITLGRSDHADIKINDISVSRIHARLNFNFQEKSLLINDMRSKFGTLVLIRGNFELNKGENLMIQTGRTLFNTEVIKKEIKSSNKNKEINEIKNSEDKNNINEEVKTDQNGNDIDINDNNNENKKEKEENENDHMNENNMEIY